MSAFCCYDDWDEWFKIEHKGKGNGKLHIRSKWEPRVEEVHLEEDENDEQAQVQKHIKELVAKKKDLSDKLDDQQDTFDRHLEENQQKLDAEKKDAEDTSDDKWDAKIERAKKMCEHEHERI